MIGCLKDKKYYVVIPSPELEKLDKEREKIRQKIISAKQNSNPHLVIKYMKLLNRIDTERKKVAKLEGVEYARI